MDLALPTGVTAEEEKDVLGGGGVVDSGVHSGIIEMVYLDAADSGAKRITIHFKNKNNVIKNTSYISNKAGEFTYKDKNSGELKPLPGYSQMDSFFTAVTGKGIGEQATALKTIKLYDFTAKKEVPKEVTVFSDAINQEIAIGIMKISEEKTTKESGYKDGTGEFRESNEFIKYFDAKNGLTVSEKAEGKTTAAFLTKWKDKYTGQVKVKKAKNSKAASGATAGAPSAAASVDDPFA